MGDPITRTQSARAAGAAYAAALRMSPRPPKEEIARLKAAFDRAKAAETNGEVTSADVPDYTEAIKAAGKKCFPGSMDNR